MTTSSIKTIYFARHGERLDWIDKTWIKSTKQRFNPPLSPYGFEQAEQLGQYVATIQPRITHIYVSPYLRTIQTALQIVKKLNENVSTNSQKTKIRLEPGFGEYFIDGTQLDQDSIYRPVHKLTEVSDHIQDFDQDYDSIIKDDYFLNTREQTREQLRHRLKRVLQSTLNAHNTNCNILIVTHAAPLIEGVRALLTGIGEQSSVVVKKEEIEIILEQETNNLSSRDLSAVRTGVCSLTHLELTDNKWIISNNGLTSYLSNGEQNPWMFPDDVSLYQSSAQIQ